MQLPLGGFLFIIDHPRMLQDYGASVHYMGHQPLNIGVFFSCFFSTPAENNAVLSFLQK